MAANRNPQRFPNRKRRRGGIRSHVHSQRRLAGAIWRFAAIPCWYTRWFHWLRWCCRHGCRAWWGATTGSTCRSSLPFISRWDDAAPSRAPSWAQAWACLRMRFRTHAIGVNGIAKTVVGFLAASVGIRIEVENQHRSPAAEFLAFPAVERDLPFRLPRFAGHGAGVELADGTDASGGEFADCRRAVSRAGPSANEGLKDREQGREGRRGKLKSGYSEA